MDEKYKAFGEGGLWRVRKNGEKIKVSSMAGAEYKLREIAKVCHFL